MGCFPIFEILFPKYDHFKLTTQNYETIFVSKMSKNGLENEKTDAFTVFLTPQNIRAAVKSIFLHPHEGGGQSSHKQF